MDSQFLDAFGKLDLIQVILLVILVFIAGLMWLVLRQQGSMREMMELFRGTTKTLTDELGAQRKSFTTREEGLTHSLDYSTQELTKVGRALLLLNQSVKEGNTDTQTNLAEQIAALTTEVDKAFENKMGTLKQTLLDNHAALLIKLDGLAQQISSQVHAAQAASPDKQREILSRLDTILGYIESFRPKLRTGEIKAVAEVDGQSAN